MKKRIIAILLAAAVLAASLPVSAVFTDVTDPAESRACELLSALGVVSGKGHGKYDPTGTMTRAEFCKVALKLAGFQSESLYGGYTRFTDVPRGKWYTCYVNAAVKEYKIIQGYGDGTFRPNNDITYREAVTILLRLLGYTQADIGDFWPQDYLTKAAALGLNAGMTAQLKSKSVLPRGQAAILLVNTLMTECKDGGHLLSGAFTIDEEPTLVLAVPATDPALAAGTARVLDSDGGVRIVPVTASVDASLVMKRGIAVWQKGRIILMRTGADAAGETLVVRSRTDRQLTDDRGAAYAVPADACLCDGAAVTDYGSAWLTLPVGRSVTLFRDDNGTPEIIVTGTAEAAPDQTAIYGVDSVIFRSGAKIVRDGESVTASAVEKYDAVSLDEATDTYYVSSVRMTLRYEDAGPHYRAPEWVTLGGVKFTVAPDAAEDFAALSFGEAVTVSLDTAGRVAGAWKGSEVPMEATAMLDSLDEESCAFTTLDGRSFTGTPSFSGFTKTDGDRLSTLYAQVGRLVTFTQGSDGKFVFKTLKYADGGDFSLQTLRIGRAETAGNLRVYEQFAADMPLVPTTLSALQATGEVYAKALHAHRNTSGRIDLMVVECITGAGYRYGVGQAKRSADETVDYGFDGTPITVARYSYAVTCRDGAGKQSATQRMVARALIEGDTPVAWRALADGTFAVELLPSAGTVQPSGFITDRRVRVGVNVLNVIEGVTVWAKARDRFITLEEALLNYDRLTLYATRDAAAGGMVCFIIAE